jgi:hypothetical protein
MIRIAITTAAFDAIAATFCSSIAHRMALAHHPDQNA